MVQSAKHILVIEDDPDIAEILNINLTEIGYQITVINDGKQGLHQLKNHSFDLLLLDIMLPGLNGLDICREVRKFAHYLPIIIISSKSTETQRVLGLELGADDYLTKPFAIAELQARVRGTFRRIAAFSEQIETQSNIIKSGELTINPITHVVQLAGTEIDLTLKEFELLWFFACHPGKVFTRLALLDQVWGYNHAGYEHTVNSHINRLRSKVERDPANPTYILTVWGVGYKFVEPVK